MESARSTFIRRGLGALGVIALLTILASGEARAQSIWTHVAAACAVDEDSASKYAAAAARFMHKGTNTGTITTRCNVTNPEDDGSDPGWNYLEVAFRDRDGNARNNIRHTIQVALYRVSNSNGGVWEMDRFDSNVDGGVSTDDQTAGIYLANHTFDFLLYAYYVDISVTRSATGAGNDSSVSIVRLTQGIE